MDFPYGETVLHIARTLSEEETSDGNDAYDEAEPKPYHHVAVAPRDGNGTAGNQNTQARDTAITGLLLMFPPPAPTVSRHDQFKVRGKLYVVDAADDPVDLVSPFTGWNPGMPVPLKRETG